MKTIWYKSSILLSSLSLRRVTTRVPTVQYPACSRGASREPPEPEDRVDPLPILERSSGYRLFCCVGRRTGRLVLDDKDRSKHMRTA